MTGLEAFSKTDLTYEIVYNQKFVPTRSSLASVKSDIGSAENVHQLRVGSQAEYGRSQFYLIDDGSKIVWDLINGNRSVKDIVNSAIASGKFKDSDDVYGTLLFLADSGALMAAQDPPLWKRVRVASSFMTQIALIKDSTRILGHVHKFTRPFLRKSTFWLAMGIAILGVAIYAPRFNNIFNDRTNFQILGSTVVGFLFYNFLVLAPVIIIHEMAHGLALLHYTGRSGEVGTGWFYFGPTFYVDVTSYWSLSRWKRIMIMWAGNLSTILIGSLLVLSQFIINYSPSTTKLIDIAAFWCFYGTLWNLAPPFETDGYYILSDILKVPNLRHDGFSYLKTKFLQLLRRPVHEPEGLTRKKRAILLGYAIFSILALGYIGFQALRFAAYMGLDAASWTQRLSAGIVGGGISALGIVVGLTSILYFGLTVSGYGVLIGNQVRKSIVRGLQFDSIQDRNLSIFFYLPAAISAQTVKRFEARIRKVSSHISLSSSIGNEGRLFAANLKIGSATLPLSEIKLHLRRFEDKFYREYQHLFSRKSHPLKLLTQFRVGNDWFPGVLWNMAGMVPIGERRETRQVLREFLNRESRNIRYLLNSTLSSAWTLEIPPAEQQQLLQDLLPVLLVEDVTMTNLAEETEHFKKHVIYGLDTIAELAAQTSLKRDEILDRPDRFQLVPLFEPIRGRILFVGRTQRIEKSLSQLGSLFVIQVWSGYSDSLLAETNLNLYSIVQSLPSIPEDLSILPDGELYQLHRFVKDLCLVANSVQDVLARMRDSVVPCKTRLKDLKMLSQIEGMSRARLLEAVLALNMENIASLPVRLKDSTELSRTSFEWSRSLLKLVDVELGRRQVRYTEQKTNALKTYPIPGAGSIILASIAVFDPEPLSKLIFFTGAVLFQAAYVARYLLLKRSIHRVSHHPSANFVRLLARIYGLTLTLGNLVVGARTLDPLNMLQNQEGREHIAPENIKPSLVPA